MKVSVVFQAGLQPASRRSRNCVKPGRTQAVEAGGGVSVPESQGDL